MMNNGFILPKWAYWLISCTWGAVMTAVGAIATLVVQLFRLGKLERHVYGFYTVIPNSSFGGIDLGPFSIVCDNPTEHLLKHEFGHSIQNCIFGPLFIFFVAIPSAIRYWYLRLSSYCVDYDYAWFEQQATMFGERYYNA